jgi:hypothetical protein
MPEGDVGASTPEIGAGSSTSTRRGKVARRSKALEQELWTAQVAQMY